jgi:hypothetical protein
MSSRSPSYGVLTGLIWVTAAGLCSAQECVPVTDRPDSGTIEAAVLVQIRHGEFEQIYLDRDGVLYELECPQCQRFSFGDRVTVEYRGLFECRTGSLNGALVSITKIGTDPHAGEKLAKEMDGAIVAKQSATRFTFAPNPPDPGVSEWTFDLPTADASLQAFKAGDAVHLKYLVSGCSGAVLFCMGIVLQIEQPVPIVVPTPPPPVPAQAVQPEERPTAPVVTGPNGGGPNESYGLLGKITVGLLTVGLLTWFVVTVTKPRKDTAATTESGLAKTGDFTVEPRPSELQVWDERSISKQMDDLRGQPPAVIAHYVESIKTRMVLNQNDKTAAVRARFLKTKVEELKLVKEGQQLMVDLEALALEREKRLKTLQLENAQLDATMRTRSELDQLTGLKQRKQIELEVAQIEKQIRDLSAPVPPPEPQLTAEQKRAEEKKKCENRIAELKAQKKEALRIEDEDERILKVNALDDALQREYERWTKLV